MVIRRPDAAPRWRLRSNVNATTANPRALAKRIEVLANRCVQPHEQRAADERVTDGDLREMWQPAEKRKVIQIEIVAGVHIKPERMRKLRGRRVCCETRIASSRVEL